MKTLKIHSFLGFFTLKKDPTYLIDLEIAPISFDSDLGCCFSRLFVHLDRLDAFLQEQQRLELRS